MAQEHEESKQDVDDTFDVLDCSFKYGGRTFEDEKAAVAFAMAQIRERMSLDDMRRMLDRQVGKPTDTRDESIKLSGLLKAIKAEEQKLKRTRKSVTGGWIEKVGDFEYTAEACKEDCGMSKEILAATYNLNDLASRRTALDQRARTTDKLTDEEDQLLIRLREAQETLQTEITRKSFAKEAEKSYGKLVPLATKPEDWYWFAVKNSFGAEFYYKDDPYTAYNARVMNQRIPMSLWSTAIGPTGKPICNKDDVPKRVEPALTHLKYPELEIKKLTMDPRLPPVYVDRGGERCLNQYRPLVIPPRPDEKYFGILAIVYAWLNFMYPGWADYILDTWAHAYERPHEKPKVCLVFGGGQGIGKNVLLSLATHTLANQGKVFFGDVNTLRGRFEDFLMKQTLIFDEVDIERGDHDYTKVKNRLKSYTGTSNSYLSVEPKGKPHTQVANIHRVYITTNFEHRVPRDNDDRRYVPLSSHVDRVQVWEFIRPLFSAIGVNIDAQGFEFLPLWDEGYGDAFTIALLGRDIGKYDPHHLPTELMEKYDENQKGYEIPQAIANALDEIAATFGRWCAEKKDVETKFPSDIEQVTQEHWPLFVAGQQILSTKASFSDEIEGERIHVSKKKNGFIERLMDNAGYKKLSHPKGKSQWVGPLPTEKSTTGAVRVQTALYYRANALPNGTTMQERQEKGDEFVKLLTEYWRSKEGVSHFWTEQRFRDLT